MTKLADSINIEETELHRSLKEESTTSGTSVSSEEPYRFVMVTFFMIVNFCIGVHVVTFSSISAIFQETYSLSSFETNSFSIVLNLCYAAACIPSIYIVDNYSMKLGLYIGALLTIAGAVLKSFVNYSLLVTFAGQVLIGIAQPFYLSASAKLAAVWFRAKRRVLVTSLAFLSNIMGSNIGFLIPTIFIPDIFSSTHSQKAKIGNFLLASGIGTVALVFPFLLLIREKPSNPPSASQDYQGFKSSNFFKNVKTLFTSRNFVLMTVVYGTVVIYSNFMLALLNQYCTIFDITLSQCSYTNLWCNLNSMGLGLFLSHLLDKSKNYKKYFIWLNICLIAAQSLFIVAMYASSNYFWVFVVCLNLNFLALTPQMSIGIDYLSELAFPVGESISNALVISIASIIGFIATYLYQWLYDTFKYSYTLNVISLGFHITSFCFLLFVSKRLPRREYEDKREGI